MVRKLKISHVSKDIQHKVHPYLKPKKCTDNSEISNDSKSIEQKIPGFAIPLVPTNFKRRGLENPSNFCYVNSVMQALITCPGFFNLFADIMIEPDNTDTKCIDPITNRVQQFLSQYCVNDQPLDISALSNILHDACVYSRPVDDDQQDAPEFLNCLLNKLNDEMDKVTSSCVNPDEKNLNNVTKLFGGVLRSTVCRVGEETTHSYQKFFTIQVNRQEASNLDDSLKWFTCKNILEGMISNEKKESVEAWQQILIEKLPKTMIFQVNYLTYGNDGLTKCCDPLKFPINLDIELEQMSSVCSGNDRCYKLLAVVYHKGFRANCGHYVANIYDANSECWLHCNDSRVSTISEKDVLNPPEKGMQENQQQILNYQGMKTLHKKPLIQINLPHATKLFLIQEENQSKFKRKLLNVV